MHPLNRYSRGCAHSDASVDVAGEIHFETVLMAHLVATPSIRHYRGGDIYVVELLFPERGYPGIKGILEKESGSPRPVEINQVDTLRAEVAGGGVSVGHE